MNGDEERLAEFREDMHGLTRGELHELNLVIKDCNDFAREAGPEFTAAALCECAQRFGYVAA
jgi:hypothetical protein